MFVNVNRGGGAKCQHQSTRGREGGQNYPKSNQRSLWTLNTNKNIHTGYLVLSKIPQLWWPVTYNFLSIRHKDYPGWLDCRPISWRKVQYRKNIRNHPFNKQIGGLKFLEFRIQTVWFQDFLNYLCPHQIWWIGRLFKILRYFMLLYLILCPILWSIWFKKKVNEDFLRVS